MAVTTTAPDTAVLRNATAVYKGYWPARELRQFHQNLYTITTLAVDTVYIHDNNTFFSDRDLANRLSLVPIVSGQRYWRRSVTCYGPANDRLALTPVYADQIFGDSTPFKDILICELQITNILTSRSLPRPVAVKSTSAFCQG